MCGVPVCTACPGARVPCPSPCRGSRCRGFASGFCAWHRASAKIALQRGPRAPSAPVCQAGSHCCSQQSPAAGKPLPWAQQTTPAPSVALGAVLSPGALSQGDDEPRGRWLVCFVCFGAAAWLVAQGEGCPEQLVTGHPLFFSSLSLFFFSSGSFCCLVWFGFGFISLSTKSSSPFALCDELAHGLSSVEAIECRRPQKSTIHGTRPGELRLRRYPSSYCAIQVLLKPFRVGTLGPAGLPPAPAHVPGPRPPRCPAGARPMFYATK